ncbi:MAG: tetratricopeptide repeat protein [Proteobacteria bacterium]|nr:tetratricopeptide repeat protein [Pseudomonadota bacterium]
MPQVGEKVQTATQLKGARVAFTGRLATMTRRQAHDLVRSAGGVPASSVSSRTAYLVIGMHGWPLTDDGRMSAKLQQAERLRARRGRIRIISEVGFLELAGRRERRPAVRKGYPLDRVSALVGVDPATIERWEYLGLVRSEAGTYDFQDIVSLQTIASLVKRGVRPQSIQQSLTALASFVGGTDRPLAQLKIVASDSGELLAQVGETLIAPDGQQQLDFAPASGPPDESPRLDPPRGDNADDLFDRAVWLEEEEQYDEAADAYRRTIALAPDRSEAYFNLGNVLRATDRTEGAEELYRLAVALDPADELAWYNLADLQEESGRYDEAIASLRTAVGACPTFADGHFNLASFLEQVAQFDEAASHWQAYVRLDPHSEWADVARAHLERQARS